ncbi:MAG: magnesium-protoporphyrin IX monomethyl ester (oxidative) cyclase, partial [Betaproteobacteria bacterium]
MNATIANDRNTDHVDLLMNKVESSADATARALVNTVLSPRFYTTRFKDFDEINVEPVRAEWD